MRSYATSVGATSTLKWTILSLLFATILFATIVLYGVRYKLARYMLEEAFIVVLAVCLGMTTLLFVLILLALFSEGARRGIRWLVGKSRVSGDTTGYQVTRLKPPRFLTLRHDTPHHGAADSSIHEPGNSSGNFRWGS